MQRIIFCLILSIAFSSCTHSIVRSGYKVRKAEYISCDIPIKKQMVITDSLQKIGEISIGESGFSTACSESHALEILRNEGCTLRADLVNIVSERRPDVWSTCYECVAEFYQFNTPNMEIQSDEKYETQYVQSRVHHDRKNNTGMILGSIGGAIVGILLVNLIL